MENNDTEIRILERDIKGILKGITDIIKVYNPDYTISFFNEAACKFYNKTPEEVIGKRCYEILARKERCKDCPFEMVAQTKQMVETERYIPEMNRFMDVCFNPILDEAGEIVLIVERLRDITEKKVNDNLRKEIEENYRQIVDSALYAKIIIQDNKIVLANNEARELIGVKFKELIGESIFKYIPKRYLKTIHKRIREILKYKKTKVTYDYEFNCSSSEITYLQISSSYIMYHNKPSILSAIRDVSEMKKDLNRAAEFQRNTLQKKFPFDEKLGIVSAYVPAHKVSGDYYRIYEINENLLIGVVFDVSGKGITAALSISAFNLLLSHVIEITQEPMDIITNLNRRLMNYSEETYIAACCFSINFEKNELKVVGAGINQFILQKKNEKSEERIVEGSFLGMFEDSEFEEQVILLEPGDRVFFFTDGLDFILDEDRVIQRYMEKISIYEFEKFIEEYLYDTIIEKGSLKDDCTVVGIEMK